VKAVLPDLCSQWAKAAAELLDISNGSINAAPVVVLAPPPPPPAPITAEVNSVSTLLDDFRATLKVFPSEKLSFLIFYFDTIF